jgi:hypothetical protein
MDRFDFDNASAIGCFAGTFLRLPVNPETCDPKILLGGDALKGGANFSQLK